MGRKSGKQPIENLRDKVNTERSSYDKEDSSDNLRIPLGILDKMSLSEEQMRKLS